MSTVVLGAGGLLGRHVVELLAGPAPVRAFDRRACDVGDAAAVARATDGAELIINCAAFTNVDKAETAEDEARRANADGAEHVARAALKNGATVVHVSTDFVFDGRKAAPYDETDAPHPLSAYARTKREGEERALAVGGKLFVVRVQALYGVGGANFASKLVELLRAGKALKLDAERRVQPTWAKPAARQILTLARRGTPGLYHVSCGGETTWANFAHAAAERLSLPRTWEEVPTAALAAPAPRPPNCLFSHRALAAAGLDEMPDWRAALDAYLTEAHS